MGRGPKKSDPAYLAVSRVSLGRGYLVIWVRWTESPSGVRVFKIFLAGPTPGRSPKGWSLRTAAPKAKGLPGKGRQVAYPRIRLHAWVNPLSTTACRQALLNKCQSKRLKAKRPGPPGADRGSLGRGYWLYMLCRWPDGPVGVNVFGEIVSARPGGSRGSNG